jgi:alkylation response protein AidB-like acyl-CoA dehydrogenase
MQAEMREQIRQIADDFAKDRSARQRRRHLDPADFERLRQTGFLLLAVPAAQQGYWRSVQESARPICDLLRLLAQGDSSVALVAAMHPAVLAFYLASPDAPPACQAAWEAQRAAVFDTARSGAWWGTITSEPGSGGDVVKTNTAAEPEPLPGQYRITGLKHFGSGSGITSFMLTSAKPVDETEADWFYLDVRGIPWDGREGMSLVAEWDGHGMIATQSHAFRFERFPATRFAWTGNMQGLSRSAGGAILCYFAAVVVGVVQVAMATARKEMARRREGLRPYEQVEWARAEVDAWLIDQAYEGMLRAVETGEGTPIGARCGKIAIAEGAEALLTRLSRILGGGTFSRHSPFGAWHEDVRALGFLRPPWGLAFDSLLQASLPDEAV